MGRPWRGPALETWRCDVEKAMRMGRRVMGWVWFVGLLIGTAYCLHAVGRSSVLTLDPQVAVVVSNRPVQLSRMTIDNVAGATGNLAQIQVFDASTVTGINAATPVWSVTLSPTTSALTQGSEGLPLAVGIDMQQGIVVEIGNTVTGVATLDTVTADVLVAPVGTRQ